MNREKLKLLLSGKKTVHVDVPEENGEESGTKDIFFSIIDNFNNKEATKKETKEDIIELLNDMFPKEDENDDDIFD